MKRFFLGASLAAGAFAALCAFLLRGHVPDTPGPTGTSAAPSIPTNRGFLEQYFRGVWEAESGQAPVP